MSNDARTSSPREEQASSEPGGQLCLESVALPHGRPGQDSVFEGLEVSGIAPEKESSPHVHEDELVLGVPVDFSRHPHLLSPKVEPWRHLGVHLQQRKKPRPGLSTAQSLPSRQGPSGIVLFDTWKCQRCPGMEASTPPTCSSGTPPPPSPFVLGQNRR